MNDNSNPFGFLYQLPDADNYFDEKFDNESLKPADMVLKSSMPTDSELNRLYDMYLKDTLITLSVIYELDLASVLMVPKIDFSRFIDKFHQLDKHSVITFIKEYICPYVYSHLYIYYDKHEDELKMLIIKNKLFSECFILSVTYINPETIKKKFRKYDKEFPVFHPADPVIFVDM